MGVSASICERTPRSMASGYASAGPSPSYLLKSIQDRLKWARKYEHQDWQQVIFTDEVAFQRVVLA
jgi:hypothetical protein